MPYDSGGEPGRAAIVGTGLIGGSIGMALRERGWHVTGTDHDPSVESRAKELGALDATGVDPSAAVTFVATPVGAVPTAARQALAVTEGVVTDVGSAKAAVVATLDDPRFVGGHPMAGSEQLGVDGATPDLFEGAVWVLTPVERTDPGAYGVVRAVVGSMGAEVLALQPDEHDALVAVVSHVPHLTAAALMRMATSTAEEHAAVLRLAAGGFRDMTRVAAGSPAIWPDICVENRSAIVATIDQLREALARIRDVVAAADRGQLLDTLSEAQAARLALPGRAVRPAELAEIRIPVRDRPGVIAEVTTLASHLGMNIFDVDMAHSSEAVGGVLQLLVARDDAERFREALVERGYRPATQLLQPPEP